MQKNISFSLLFLALLISGCSTQQTSRNSSTGPQQEIIKAPFDHAWRAIQIAMANYPITINDPDTGVLETDFIRGEKVWISPASTLTKQQIAGSYRYKLIVRAIKARSEQPESNIKITISKQAEMQKDFFSSYERSMSDGLEEAAIGYRIKRELQIHKNLQKLQSEKK